MLRWGLFYCKDSVKKMLYLGPFIQSTLYFQKASPRRWEQFSCVSHCWPSETQAGRTTQTNWFLSNEIFRVDDHWPINMLSCHSGQFLLTRDNFFITRDNFCPHSRQFLSRASKIVPKPQKNCPERLKNCPEQLKNCPEYYYHSFSSFCRERKVLNKVKVT